MPASTRGMKKLTTDPSKVPELRSPSMNLLTPSLEVPITIDVEMQETAVVEPSNRQWGSLPYLGQYVSALSPSMEASNNLSWEFALLDHKAKDPPTPFDTNLAMEPPGEERVAVTIIPKMTSSQNETTSHNTTNPQEAGGNISQKPPVTEPPNAGVDALGVDTFESAMGPEISAAFPQHTTETQVPVNTQAVFRSKTPEDTRPNPEYLEQLKSVLNILVNTAVDMVGETNSGRGFSILDVAAAIMSQNISTPSCSLPASKLGSSATPVPVQPRNVQGHITHGGNSTELKRAESEGQQDESSLLSKQSVPTKRKSSQLPDCGGQQKRKPSSREPRDKEILRKNEKRPTFRNPPMDLMCKYGLPGSQEESQQNDPLGASMKNPITIT